jgi:hypothetical protein
MKRLLISLVLSAVGSVVLFAGAAVSGGLCHCMTAMFNLFPYGTFAIMKLGWDNLGLALALLQFPIYAVSITMIKGVRWKIILLLLFLFLHVVAASFVLKDYCRGRARCEVLPAHGRVRVNSV